jgi:hypothetical protein
VPQAIKPDAFAVDAGGNTQLAERLRYPSGGSATGARLSRQLLLQPGGLPQEGYTALPAVSRQQGVPACCDHPGRGPAATARCGAEGDPATCTTKTQLGGKPKDLGAAPIGEMETRLPPLSVTGVTPP